MRINFSSLNSKGILIESIVVPAISLTINLSSLINLFIKVDLPAFGRPRTATFFPSGISIDRSGNFFSRMDFKILIFIECSALNSKNYLIPFICKSSLIDDFDFLSTLFNTVINSLLSFRSL